MDLGGDSTSNRNEYQEYFLGSKGGRCVGPTTLPPSCAECLEIWEPQPPGTLRAYNGAVFLPFYLYQIIPQCNIFTKFGEVRSVYHWAVGLVVIRTLYKTFYNLLSKQELAAAPVISTLFSLSHSSRRPLLEIQKLYFALIIQYNYMQ